MYNISTCVSCDVMHMGCRAPLNLLIIHNHHVHSLPPVIKIALWLQFGGVQYMQHTEISETQSVSLDTSNWTILCRAWKDEARTTFKSEVRLVSELISIQIQTSKCFFSRMKAMPSPAVGSSHLWQTSFHLYLMIPSDKWITPKTYLLEMFEWNWHILFH